MKRDESDDSDWSGTNWEALQLGIQGETLCWDPQKLLSVPEGWDIKRGLKERKIMDSS